MATVTLKGNTIHTLGTLPKIGEKAPDFRLAKGDLSNANLGDYKGQKLILNIFHSLDTGTCAASVREFNKVATQLDNTKVLCISKDLPFAMSRFCVAEGIENVEMLSDFRDGSFGRDYQLTFTDGPVEGLLSRSIVVLDESGTVVYSEQVQEVVEEPNYEAALSAL
jgi:thiol peroxidase